MTFAPKRARDVPLFVAGLPIFSRAYYATKPFDESTLDVPLGSGAYKVGRFEPGRYIEYERVKDWWGADLPVARGQNNFDVVRFEYYRDRDVGFEGFTAGSYLFREEFTSRTWATRYDFPAVKDGRVKRDDHSRRYALGRAGLVHQYAARESSPTRGCARRCATRSISNGPTRPSCTASYERTVSVFQNSDMMAEGKPSADELALLEPFRGQRARRGVRRALCAAGLRRLRPGSRAAAQGLAASQGCRLRRSRTASASCRTASPSPSNF